eukprot:6707191-Lingulodinium_polyedra.AAC.1
MAMVKTDAFLLLFPSRLTAMTHFHALASGLMAMVNLSVHLHTLNGEVVFFSHLPTAEPCVRALAATR